MVMSYLWTGLLVISLFCSVLTGNTRALSAAFSESARSALELTLTLAGPLCLWSGCGALLQASGLQRFLSRLTGPLLLRLFPNAGNNEALRDCLSGNFCANLLGLGNAATPLGIRAAKLMKDDPASLCRLVVLNTASIQLLPISVANLRSTLGCETPMDILVPVWVTSVCAAAVGLCAEGLLRRCGEPLGDSRKPQATSCK